MLFQWSCVGLNFAPMMSNIQTKIHVTVASEPERIGVFLTSSCVHVTDISCGVVYEATLASLVLFRSYCYVTKIYMTRRQKATKATKDSLQKTACRDCRSSEKATGATGSGVGQHGQDKEWGNAQRSWNSTISQNRRRLPPLTRGVKIFLQYAGKL